MSDCRRLRLREQAPTKGPVRAPMRKARNRLGSVSCSNEESTEGEDDTVGCGRKISVNRNRVADHPKDSDRGLRVGSKKSSKSNGLSVPLAEEDVIDGFLILSFVTYQDLESDTKGSADTLSLADVGDVLADGVTSQSEGETKEDAEIRNVSEHFGELDPILAKENPMVNGLAELEKDEEIGENNNEPTTPNQNFTVMSPKPEEFPPIREAIPSKEIRSAENDQAFNKICDTAEEAKKVPPDLEVPRPETPKQDAVQVQNKRISPFPLKNTHFLPLQNGPLQQPEPSAAVAAVTVPTTATNPATVPASSQLGSANPAPLPSSTSPAGGVPFPTSLLSHEEFPVSPTAASKTVSPLLGSKGYDSVVKSPRGSNSDVVHSLPYPICSSYSDYTISYSANQYSNNKHSYINQEVRDSQRVHHQKLVTNSYYNHHPQPVVDKYSNSREVVPRSNSKEVVSCDNYSTENFLDNRFENKTANAELGYCIGQAYPNEKTCDPQTICKKSSANNVYNFKTSELLTQHSNENIVKTTNDKTGGKITGDLYANSSKSKIPNRTTYYQSIVNKSHSRHKSSRRVLPASAYENSKQVINNYSASKPELTQVPPNKPVQYTSHHYSTENKKHDYYQSLSTSNTGTTNTYNYSTYKPDVPQTHVNNSISHNNYPTESQSSGSRSYKTSSDHSVSSYREKQTIPSVVNTSTKSYSYHNNRNFIDTSTKVSTDTASTYGNGDYYQKGSVSYSRSGTNQSAISENFKSYNHSGDHSTYQNKNSNYHHSRTSNEKSSRNYTTQDGSYKSYRQELVPKQNSDESRGYCVPNEGSTYLNYGSSSSLKSKDTVAHSVEPSKVVSHEPSQNISVESNSSVHPPVGGDSNLYQSTPARDKPTFYPYAEQAHYSHRRTTTPPAASKPAAAFEPIAPTKDTEAFRLLGSSTAISSYPQKTAVLSPPPVSDNSRNSVKTLWSPTSTTASLTNTTSREIIAASSRDSHSSHSNSSISSLSQLSQSLGPVPQGKEGIPAQSSKEFQREGRSSSNGHSRSSSRNETPVCSTATVTTTCSTSTNSSSSYGVSGSLTSLIFSKPSWTSPSVTTVLTNPGSHFTPPASGRLGSPVPSVLPLAPSLPSSHHSSPFSNHPSAGALHPAGHHVMFAPPLPPAGSLSSPSLPPAGPSPFGGDSLFAPPPPSTDLLNIRRELDTRFLASQDRSINVPPPPYLRAEMHQHQHQHTHMHQHSPFLPPPLGGSLLPPSAAHLYDKFPKVDSSFYGRNALGLPTYPISPLLAPGSATATPTPFAPPGHMAAFQPKISPLVKAKTMKSGRWCAMHVRISWEIYHHQQKQQADSQKGGSGPTKTVTDLLRPPNHLFGAIPRPHELGFASPLLGAAASIHARSPYDVSPQHPSFLGPTPAHLGLTPFARPNYPSMGVPGNSFGGLGSLAGLTGASMLAGRDLGPGYLGMGQDPWSRLHRTPPNFPSPSTMNPTSWGGLKAEAERDRVQKREDQEKEKEKQKRADLEKREKENEKSKEISRESKKEHEKQRERDRENRVSHVSSNPDSIRNGEVIERNRERDWERVRERRESSRSPMRTHKSDGSLDVSNSSGHKSDIKVKEEKKEEEHKKDSLIDVSGSADRERTKSNNEPTHQELANDYMSRSMLSGLPMGLSPSEQARLAGSLGPMSQVPPHHFWNLPPQTAASVERYRNLELQHAREMDREQLMQKYASLSSVMPLLPERYREAELARHLSSSEAAAREIERQLQADRDRQVYERTKLPPPPLRPNDPPYVPPPGLPPSGGLFPPLSNPFMNSLCAPNYPPRTKPGSPGGIGNGIPPPLIPCVSQGGSPVTTSTTPSPLHLKLSTASNSNVDGSREHYASKERRELTSHSSGDVESQSR